MVIFGAQNMAVYHLSFTNKTGGYKLIGSKSLLKVDMTPDSKVQVAKLVTAQAAHVKNYYAQFIFMLGWSKSARFDHVRLDLTTIKSPTNENTLNFNIVSNNVF